MAGPVVTYDWRERRRAPLPSRGLSSEEQTWLENRFQLPDWLVRLGLNMEVWPVTTTITPAMRAIVAGERAARAAGRAQTVRRMTMEALQGGARPEEIAQTWIDAMRTLGLRQVKATKELEEMAKVAQVAQKPTKLSRLQQARELMYQHATTTPERVLRKTAQHEGYSVSLETGKIPYSGVMMGKYTNTDPRVTVKPTVGAQELFQHVAKNLEALRKPGGEDYLGTWEGVIPGSPKQVYLDVSHRFPGGQREPKKWLRKKLNEEAVRAATKAGEMKAQGVGFNPALPNRTDKIPGELEVPGVTIPARDVVPVGNVNEFLRSEEFQNRLNEMYQVGLPVHQAAQATYPRGGVTGTNWWDLHGGPIERVYTGPEGPLTLRQVSGMLASTSPQTNPTENMRFASEYLRRLIKGEPVIQPNYRVPQTAMTRRGAKMFGEATKVPNLQKAAAGDIEKLQADKVNDMARALMGEPNVSVLDRRYAKLGEAPERGIYMDVTPDKIEPAMVSGNITPYPVMQNAVRDAARRHGLSESEFSAIVWEGIGETIRRTGKLYGTAHEAGAIPAASGGFDAIFPKLVAEKAKAWGLTVPEFEAKLRAGDAELMSAILAAPVGWQAYEAWLSSTPPASAGTPRR